MDLRETSNGFGTIVDGAAGPDGAVSTWGGGVGGGVSLSRALGIGFRFERLVVSTGCGRNCRLSGLGGVLGFEVLGFGVLGLMEK